VKIKITGSNGYLGRLISSQLRKNGHSVSGISREVLYTNIEALKEEIRDTDIIINLAGSPILKRWTKSNKNQIYESRAHTTRNLIQAINLLNENERPLKFISASAIGIYKNGNLHTESSQNFSDGFLFSVTSNWENELSKLPDSVQQNIFRIGLVIGKDAKTIKNLILPFKLGFGASLGNGKQAFPFIHVQDLVNAFIWAIENKTTSGVFNLVSPCTITYKEFTLAFAKKLNRPAFLSIPAFLLKAILGEASSLLLASPMVEPKALIDAGYKFEYPTIDQALSEILT
jgi:uncharacterized protein (TIGR01777 family)